MLNEYFREGNYHKIIELYENKMPSDVSDINEVRKVAESYRRLGKIKDSICWMERLVTLQPDNRYLDKLKELYLQIQPSTEQWKWFWKVSEGKSKECAMIAEYFYEKENGADIEHRKKLLRDMLSVVSYEDEIYFEAVELLDKKYYLNEILKRTNKAASHHKAEAMLNEIKKAEKKENKKSFAKHLIERIKREVPLSIEELFSDIVGMGNIQEEIGALYQHLKVNNNRIDQIAIPYNFIIGGQKGSGKTRLAYIIAELLYTTDLSRVREPLEVSAISLLENMEELLKNAPPVVIINNTECLWKSSTLETDNVKADGDNNQVWLLLEQLLEEGVYSQEHFYIFLGESEAMDSLLSNNAKIRNLVTYLKIPVYTSEELHRIGLKMIAKDGYEITKDGSEQFYQEIRKKSVLGDFANGHTIQNLIIEAKKNMAYRISNEGGTRCFDARDFVILDTSQESLEELLQQLHALTGLETVKEEVEGKLALYRKREEDRKAGIACEEEESQTLNTLLLGPPGTGKTTVARLLGKIYSAIGILPRGDIFL